MRKKNYISLCGLPDAGKSTFIRNFVKYATKRDVPVDSLCDEEVKEMTIRSAQILCRLPGSSYDIVFLDCPGHLELYDEIKSCLSKSDLVIVINDHKRYTKSASAKYVEEIKKLRSELRLPKSRSMKILNLYSHSSSSEVGHYDFSDDVIYQINDGIRIQALDDLKSYIFENIDLSGSSMLVDPADTAKRIIQVSLNFAENPAGCISYGKDSIVMLALTKELGLIDEVKWYYLVTGFDMDGLNEKFISSVNKFFGVDIEPYRIIPDSPNWTFEKKTVQEMMLKKAEMLNKLIKRKKHDYVFMGIRRDEEGTRAKEKFFSIRSNDGTADLYSQQLEVFGAEIGNIYKVFDDKREHVRVHPLLDVTEADAWLYIKEHNLPYSSDYVSVDGKRFRSLGDKPITTPISSDAKTVDDIVDEVTWSLLPERACRAKQDGFAKNNMEIIRSKGFF